MSPSRCACLDELKPDLRYECDSYWQWLGRARSMEDISYRDFITMRIGVLCRAAFVTPIVRARLGTVFDPACWCLQICASPPTSRSGANYVPAWKSVEAVLGLRLEHPNVVRTFKHSTVLVQV